MTRTLGLAPSAGEIDAIARTTLARLPAEFRRHLGDIVLLVEDFADEETLADLELESPFDLTGVYEGVTVAVRGCEQSGTMPDRVRLFRVPILLEWAERGDETLEHLVAHVVIHEIGHHFGLSDEDMHALEEMAG